MKINRARCRRQCEAHATVLRSRCAPAHHARRAAVILEGAIVISVFLVILIATMDLGLAVLRHNVLSEASRRLARTASVHGEKAAPESTTWGPAKYKGTAGDGTEYANSVEDILVTMNPQSVVLTLEWLDASNESGQRVRATVQMKHSTIIPYLFGDKDLQLTAVSQMRIEH